ncbi:MAG: 4-hydroxythreonine-4-phosphate dehydrogenase PdxA [Thermoanaerobaculia bacterium]
MKPGSDVPIVALTQGEPAGIGPEIAIKLLAAEGGGDRRWYPLLVAERAALATLRDSVPGDWWDRLSFLEGPPDRNQLEELDREQIPVLDPVGRKRTVKPGWSTPADAAGALAALDAGIAMARAGQVDALITGPVSKSSIAQHQRPDFRGHTDYLATACGLERYGRDYLMTFVTTDMQVALLTTHLPLTEAIAAVDQASIVAALELMSKHAGGSIAVAGLNPHAGEDGLLGEEDQDIIAPAVATARAHGLDVHGPLSADSLFARARRGEFDWVLALYHDQGLIAVKTAAFGRTTNWTLGLPILRTSVDHGTAFEIAGQGRADVGPLRSVVETTLRLLSGKLPSVRKGAGPL